MSLIKDKYKLTNFLLITTLLFVLSCSKTKTTFVPKTYHATTSLFNGYYNANLAYKEALTQLEEGYIMPENEMIEVVYYGTENEIKGLTAQFDKIVEKNDVVIFKHPNGGWVDDCRLLNGKAQFYKKEYELAMENFQDILNNYPDSDLIPEVHLWRAKTFYMMENPEMTRNILSKQIIQNDTIELKKEVKAEMGHFMARMAIESDSFRQAANLLSTHIEFVSSRRRKARSYFLLGQLYAASNQLDKALENFDIVAKYSNNYDFLFRTKMEVAKLYIQTQEGSDDSQIREYLAKLLKDEKNIDYHDQIYYQFAKLEIKRDSLENALGYLAESTSSSVNNQRQKALSYYEAGKIYFYDYQDYPSAQAYYDSAAQSVTENMAEYKTITALAKTLGEYIYHLNTIHFQDSMLWVASLPEDKQNALIDSLVEEERARKQKEKEEELARLAAEQQNGASSFQLNQAFQQQARNRNSSGGGAGFYFENPQAVSSGKIQFEQLWGKRRNEDNWRRSKKSSSGFPGADQQLAGQETEVDSAMLEKYGDKYVYIKDIPKTEEEVQASKDKIEESMYKLGQVYSQKLNEPDSAIVTYERLLDRFEDSEYSLRTRYALYKLYSEYGNPLSQAQANYIINNHPKTVYAYLILGKDPNELKEEEKEYLFAYDGLFAAFNNKEYETSLGFSEFLLAAYAERSKTDIAKLQYIRGMSYGYTGMKDSLRSILTHVVNTYPDAEVTPPAKKTLELMDKGFTKTNKSGPGSGADDGGEFSDPKHPRYVGFTDKLRPNDKIFVLMYFDKSLMSKSEATNKIKAFNQAYFKDLKLKPYTFIYKQQHLLPYISSFRKLEDAKKYMDQFLNDPASEKFKQDGKLEIFYISHTNFKVAYGKKRMEDYILYKTHILK